MEAITEVNYNSELSGGWSITWVQGGKSRFCHSLSFVQIGRNVNSAKRRAWFDSRLWAIQESFAELGLALPCQCLGGESAAGRRGTSRRETVRWRSRGHQEPRVVMCAMQGAATLRTARLAQAAGHPSDNMLRLLLTGRPAVFGGSTTSADYAPRRLLRAETALQLVRPAAPADSRDIGPARQSSARPASALSATAGPAYCGWTPRPRANRRDRSRWRPSDGPWDWRLGRGTDPIRGNRDSLWPKSGRRHRRCCHAHRHACSRHHLGRCSAAGSASIPR